MHLELHVVENSVELRNFSLPTDFKWCIIGQEPMQKLQINSMKWANKDYYSQNGAEVRINKQK